MSTSEAAARKERDPTMEERQEEGMGELGQNEMDRGITMSRNTKGGKEGAKEISTGTAVGSQERVPTVEEREEGTGGHGEGSGGTPMSRSPEVIMAALKKRKVMLESSSMKGGTEGPKEGEQQGGGDRGSTLPRSSVASRSPRPWQDKRKRSSRARLCDLLPKPSKVGLDSMMSQAAEIIQQRQGTTHDLEGLDGAAKLKKVLPEAAHLTGSDSLLNAAADFLERHPDN